MLACEAQPRLLLSHQGTPTALESAHDPEQAYQARDERPLQSAGHGPNLWLRRRQRQLARCRTKSRRQGLRSASRGWGVSPANGSQSVCRAMLRWLICCVSALRSERFSGRPMRCWSPHPAKTGAEACRPSQPGWEAAAASTTRRSRNLPGRRRGPWH